MESKKKQTAATPPTKLITVANRGERESRPSSGATTITIIGTLTILRAKGENFLLIMDEKFHESNSLFRPRRHSLPLAHYLMARLPFLTCLLPKKKHVPREEHGQKDERFIALGPL